ncbi:MAG: hypothetical protein JO307_31675 [Bryobacterales bacterium]|nr:hypothetical protein [Bryobacterales bacterium]MBV9398911.1 hypothetical protein [Bryobacterales bacterium]
MEWMNQLKDMFSKYSGQSGGTATIAEDAHRDFEQVAQSAPSNVVADGISQAFRSDETPPFPGMLANLFSHSNPNQRAGVLNELMGSLGSGALASLPGLGGLSSLLSGGSVTPDQVNQISPEQVQQIATHAERQDPSVVDRVSSFYAQHPQVMKAAGGLALSIALRHMLRGK